MVVTIVLLVLASLLPVQYPQKGGRTQPCNTEPLMPNLTVKKDTQVTGTVRDFMGRLIGNSNVELRLYSSPFQQVSVQNIATDEDGRFDLGAVKAGRYRILVAPTARFKEPTSLVCSSDAACILDISLIDNTDPVDPSCPRR